MQVLLVYEYRCLSVSLCEVSRRKGEERRDAKKKRRTKEKSTRRQTKKKSSELDGLREQRGAKGKRGWLDNIAPVCKYSWAGRRLGFEVVEGIDG